MTTTPRRIFNALAADPWAIAPDWLRAIAAIADREDLSPALIDRLADYHGITPEAVQSRVGQRPDGSYRMRLRDGVAIIPIDGPIFPKATMLQMISGAASLQLIALDFAKALDDPDIRAIVLELDSPGGVVGGISEMAGTIRGARGRKPIVAYVDGVAASAAFWLAAAADEIVIGDTGVVGSIGVVAQVTVQEKPDQAGERTYEIVSTNAANKRPDPTSEDGRAQIVARLDALESVFVGSVAAYLGMSASELVAAGDNGGVRVGSDAVAAGLATRLGNFEDLLTELTGRRPTDKPSAGPVAAQHETKGTDMDLTDVTAEQLAAENPDLAAALRDRGAEAERQRVAALDAAALPGFETLLADHKADGSKTDIDLIRAQNAVIREQGAAALQTAAAEDEALKGQLPAVDPGETGGGVDEARARLGGDDGPKAGDPQDDAAVAGDKARFAASAGLQKDFGNSEKAYLRYCQDIRAGNIRAVTQPAAA